MQFRVDPADLFHHTLRNDNIGYCNQQEAGMMEIGGFQHNRLAGVAIDNRIAHTLDLLDPPVIQVYHHQSQLQPL